MAGLALSRQAKRRAGAGGHSLVELLVVTGAMSILLAMAVPAYREQGARAHRSIAAMTLLRAASCQARLKEKHGHYDTGACRPADNERYHFRYELSENATASEYTLLAEPSGAQAADACGWLSIDQIGQRGVGHASAGVARCWSGR